MVATIISVLVVLFLGIDLLIAIAIEAEWRRNSMFRIDVICSRRLSNRILASALNLLEKRPAMYMTSLVMGYSAIGVALYHFA